MGSSRQLPSTLTQDPHSPLHTQAGQTPRVTRDRKQRCCPESHGLCGQPHLMGLSSRCPSADRTDRVTRASTAVSRPVSHGACGRLTQT